MKYEHRAAKGRCGSAPKLKTKDSFSDLSGFISIFGFNDEVCDYIEGIRAMHGIGKFPLYADVLYLDFDDNPEGEQRTITKLKELGLSFKVYFTGNRGHHSHSPIEPMERVGLSH